MELLSEKVKELRKKKGWAQDDMAREIGVSLNQAIHLEQGLWHFALLLIPPPGCKIVVPDF